MSATVSFRKTNQVTIFGAGVVSPNYQVKVTGEVSDGSTKTPFTLTGEKTASLIAGDKTVSVNHSSSADGTVTLNFQYSDDGGKTWKASTVSSNIQHPDSPAAADVVTEIVADAGATNHRATVTVAQMPLTKY